MDRVNYIIHLVSGILFAGLGVLLLLPAMLISFFAVIFNGNIIGLLMIIMSAVILYTAFLCFRNGIQDRKLFITDPALYKSNELKTSAFSVLSALIVLFVLFAYNQNISGIIEYGFGMFLAAAVILLAANLLSLVLTASRQNK